MARNWAITIGINGYRYLSQLNYAVTDADAVRQFFSEGLGFHQVYHFTDKSEPIKQDRGPALVSQPTATTLRRFLRTRFEEPFLRDGDNLWFFFAGHGIRHENRDYLMPQDGDRGDLENSAIPLHYISERLRRSGADNVILLIDACRSDKEGRRDGFGFGAERQQGVITIFSCSPEEPAYEIEELQQGAFTHALLESLRLEGEGNCATVERLYQRLRYTVPQLTLQYKRVSQTPYGMIEPPSKNHLILLPRQATLTDVLTLRYDALSAESRDPTMAKQLWIRVLMVSPGDPEAIAGIERLSRGNSAPSEVPDPMPPSAPVAAPSPSNTSGSRRVEEPVPQSLPSVQPTYRPERLEPLAVPPKTVVPVSSALPTFQPPGPQPSQPTRSANAAAQSSPPVRPSSGSTSPSQPFVSPSAPKTPLFGALIDRISRRKAIQILGFAGGGLGSILLGRAVLQSGSNPSQPEMASPLTDADFMPVEFETATVNEKGDVTKGTGESKVFKESIGEISLDLIPIKGRTFMMGSPDGEGYDTEKPQHKVMILPFLMGRHQVTQAQWRAVAALTKVERDLKVDPSNFKGSDFPVEQVSWDDALEFCKRLSQHTGRAYRLPSEAEWEYACRAGTTTEFHFGETLTANLSNYNATYTYGSGPKGEYRQKTTEVGSFPANAFGLYDMHGNVSEWCQDHWHENYQGAPDNGSTWITDGDASKRLLRGGSWNDDPRNCRSANRDGYARVYRFDIIGFRVVCVSS
jgi:formylglycine-generating enzyme required for sulfatase activity/uncharacterized caspase-like protein